MIGGASMTSYDNPYQNLRRGAYGQMQNAMRQGLYGGTAQTHTVTNTDVTTWGVQVNTDCFQTLPEPAPLAFSQHPSVAEIKGMSLLFEHLTPEQLKSYNEHGYFDVKGGTTGKTYRIKYGHTHNIDELDADMQPAASLCFRLESGLGYPDYVMGDHLLAQKICLEVDEQDTLEVANRIEMRAPPVGYVTGTVQTPGPRYGMRLNDPTGAVTVMDVICGG